MAETNPNSASDHINAFSYGMGYTIYMIPGSWINIFQILPS